MNTIESKFSRILYLIFVDDPSSFLLKRTISLTLSEDKLHPSVELVFDFDDETIQSSVNISPPRKYFFKKQIKPNLGAFY